MGKTVATAFTTEHSGLLWRACPHTCCHTEPKNNPGAWMPNHCYIFPVGINARASDHLSPKTTTHSCGGVCPDIHSLRPATLAEGIRATILWAQSLGRLEIDSIGNESARKWVSAIGAEENSGGGKLKGVWLELWRAAVEPTFPVLFQSPRTDGAIGPDGRCQYPDLPTHLNTSVRPFDLAAAEDCRVAIDGGTLPGTPRLLIDPDALGAVPFNSHSNPTGQPSSVADALPSDRFFWIEGTQGFDKNAGLFARKPASFPRAISVIVTPVELADAPLKNRTKAQDMASSNFYWTYTLFDLSVTRHAQFYQMWACSELLQRLYYFDVKESRKFCYLYLHEWAMLPLLFWQKGAHVNFIHNDDFLRLLEDRENHPEWSTVQASQLVIGRVFIPPPSEGDPTEFNQSHKHNPNPHQLETFEILGGLGPRFWPHPACDVVTQQKLRMQIILSQSVTEAGGFGERPFQIYSVAEGLDALKEGWVLKMEHGADARYVFKTNDEETRERFRNIFDLLGAPADPAIPKRVFFTMKFNPSIIALGEVRVFICFGTIVQAYHTIPFPRPDEKHLPPEKYSYWRAQPAYGRLASLSKIKIWDGQDPAPTSASGRDDELWFSNSSAYSMEGTEELYKFVFHVYEDVIEREENVFKRLTNGVPGAASLRAFCRIDVGLVLKEGKYLYVVNEVQEGQCGLFMLDNAQFIVPNGFIEGYLRGVFEK
ncbi:hypothetical protein BDP27DRAFT_1430496 [Rhodocollybia butyracea]|uniref:Uncharacterized protein n=1 Tax=Rhodocollybia butyracea TaxID=206335 RepID=A0A9P5PCA7_9AGAR|nr:hypothetical protein BDP27DRAFT_1430496 [Rhodocollybia butyracea]